MCKSSTTCPSYKALARHDLPRRWAGNLLPSVHACCLWLYGDGLIDGVLFVCFCFPSPVVTAHRQYNFSSIERLWSSLVGLGLHPIVELSWMPAFLANCSWSVAPADCHADYGIPCNYTRAGIPRCSGDMVCVSAKRTRNQRLGNHSTLP